MRWLDKMSDNIKKGIRNWLQVQPPGAYALMIQEIADFELSAIRNRIWYRGDGNELEQMYGQNPEYADKMKFWACKCSPGMEMRKIHTGLPSLIVKILTSIVLTDMNDFEFKEAVQEGIWKEIEKENNFRKMLEKALKETLFIGDGAFKVTFDTDISTYPLLEWYPGEKIEIVMRRGRLKEVIFKTAYKADSTQYVLHEHYGYGYVKNVLYKGEQEVPVDTLEITKNVKDVIFDRSVILAIPLHVYESAKFEGRGGSIYDGKLDAFDSFDEAWSQWMDALRAGRSKEYIPESLIPRHPATGAIMKPNAFDNRYIKTDNDMSENSKNEISLKQPNIPHESYLATYITALDLCLQGIISPSTLGIDVKKLDNADAQREKEKTTLYTRDAIVEALQNVLPKVVETSVNAFHILKKEGIQEVKVDIPFGEYANPSFESQVETVGKGKTQGIMSIEACVDELYGDTKNDDWKKEEVARLKNEQGITEMEEPAVNLAAGNFNVKGEFGDGSQNRKQTIPDEPEGGKQAPGTDE